MSKKDRYAGLSPAHKAAYQQMVASLPKNSRCVQRGEASCESVVPCYICDQTSRCTLNPGHDANHLIDCRECLQWREV